MEPSCLDSLSEEISEGEASGGAPSAFSPGPPRPAVQIPLKKYSPLDWFGYFDEETDVSIPGTNDVFHVYKAGSAGPVVFCLHGGGYSGLSFALSASIIKAKAQVVAMDLRGHGKSTTDNDLDLSIETLSDDVLAVMKTMFEDSLPAVVLVGHSMGGSVAVHVAAKKTLQNIYGLIVVDVVEGTAMASLVHMQKILAARMQHFHTIEKAVEWSIKGGSLRNPESARLSVPSTLKYDHSKKCYTYRTPLEETERYWKGWYEGLSEKFLSCSAPKLLLLAGTDRLDRANFRLWSSAGLAMPSRRTWQKNLHLSCSISSLGIVLVLVVLRYRRSLGAFLFLLLRLQAVYDLIVEYMSCRGGSTL